MKLLEDRILNDGNVLGENILKVDSFLTHQVDFDLMREIFHISPCSHNAGAASMALMRVSLRRWTAAADAKSSQRDR